VTEGGRKICVRVGIDGYDPAITASDSSGEKGRDGCLSDPALPGYGDLHEYFLHKEQTVTASYTATVGLSINLSDIEPGSPTMWL
jgi:hypothetical protein